MALIQKSEAMKPIVIIFLFAIMSSCNFSDMRVILSGGFEFVDEGDFNKVIDGNNFHIPCRILAYNYSNDFIIAAQKPTDDCFISSDSIYYKEGKNKTYYWLIIHRQHLNIGPMTESEFLNARLLYKVPETLNLKPVN